MNDIGLKPEAGASSTWESVAPVQIQHQHHHENVTVVVPTPIKMEPGMALPSPGSQTPQTPQVYFLIHLSIYSNKN